MLCLYTSDFYTLSPQSIPLIRDKIQQTFVRTGLDKRSHEGKTLRRILETFPRDELFQCGSAELYEIVTAVAAINDRYQVRLFIRPDSFEIGRASCRERGKLGMVER